MTCMIGTVAADGFVKSVLANFERQRAEQEHLMDRLGVNATLADFERQRAEQKRLMDRLGVNAALAQYQRLMECILVKSALAQSSHPCEESDRKTFESVGFETLKAAPTVLERELAAEVQDCAIELLALQIEDNLPEWLKSNRTVLAWNLALAAHNFIIGLMRVTGRTPELYTLNSSVLSSLLMRVPRR